MGDWMPFEMIDGEFVLEAKVNNVDTKVSLATDSLANSINESFLKKHNIPYDENSRFTLSFMDKELEISRLTFYEGDTNIGLRLHPWFEVGPIRQIDFIKSRLRFLSRKAVNMYRNDNLKIRGGTTNSTNLAALTMVEDEKYYFAMIEPRASFTTVSRDLALESGWLDKYQISPSKLGDSAAGLEDYDFMQVPNVTLGPFEFDYAIIITYKQSKYDQDIVTNLDNTHSHTRFYDGVLGLDILRNFVVTYDSNKRKVHIDVR